MTDEELDRAYTALCNGMAEVGEAHAQRFLALLCMGLLVRVDRGEDVLELIEVVKARSVEPQPR
ncbi:hypothetical protein [Ramlibacter sp.]|uniref:hypothetical protein n=1 Tax=Ramlibacter sp. TaxID=1917967 RepID=UPI002D55FF83|nr:hypothetical protein [Ramlibacter sp.]HYD77328.1 hypothetical protein [Ramlibacter sp.]